MAKLHVHESRWVCQACGYIFAALPAVRAGEAETQPQACPECGSQTLKKMDEAGF
jgi:ribosomal protein S27AE